MALLRIAGEWAAAALAAVVLLYLAGFVLIRVGGVGIEAPEPPSATIENETNEELRLETWGTDGRWVPALPGSVRPGEVRPIYLPDDDHDLRGSDGCIVGPLKASDGAGRIVDTLRGQLCEDDVWRIAAERSP